MALKFLNKKGWHSGSLRNIENVWNAEQKHEAEQKELEELRKQIVEERERSEFRDLQVQVGLVPKKMLENEANRTTSKSTGLPRKRFYRARAHSNPLSPHLLDECAYVLRIGGIIYTITDVEELGEWMKACLEDHPMFEALTNEELDRSCYKALDYCN